MELKQNIDLKQTRKIIDLTKKRPGGYLGVDIYRPTDALRRTGHGTSASLAR